MNKNKAQQEQVTKETKVEVLPPRKGCTIPLNGCLYLFILIFFTGAAYNLKKWSDIKVQEEELKLQQMQKGTVVDTTPVVTPDTIKIGKYQHAYMPIRKMLQHQR
ncbi:MAG: hypothetical protein MJ156_02745 [Alphaproteobacteria bacterium]|nr:hypothetical protein [Alphaproteobacteria bacterium]